MMTASRLKRAYAGLRARNTDGFLVSSPANITYLTGYLSRDSYLLVSEKKNIYFTDSRYAAEARCALKGRISVVETHGSVFQLIAKAAADLGLISVAFEQRHLPYAEYDRIRSHLDNSIVLVPVHGIVEELRMIKTPAEISRIKKALQITKGALKFIEKKLQPGMKEIEVVGELEHFIRYHGAGGAAFEIIAASGPNSAYAHHVPGHRKLKSGEPMLIDIGVDVGGYKSDLTRVFFLGKIKVLARQVFKIVAAAQARAIARIRPGIAASSVDAAGRDLIKNKGFAKCFGHNIGHGVGLEVHEEPHISPGSDQILKAGMVFTVEPAIYLPGKFGIRIEDMVLVTKNGCVKL